MSCATRGQADENLDSTERETGTKRVFLCYAESPDGVQWTRPPLGLVEFDGSRENNIIREIGGGDSVFFNIIKDSEDPDPMRRYKALGFGHGSTQMILQGEAPQEPGVCVTYSPDGLNWSDEHTVVMTSRDVTDSDCIFPRRDPATGKWVGFFRPRTRPKRRFIGYAQSDDFEHWTFPRMLFSMDSGDDEWTEFYGLAATCADGYRIGGLWVFHNSPTQTPMTNELVYSRDGVNYYRALPGQQWLPLGPAGSVDSRQLQPMALIEHDHQMLIYYNASNVDHKQRGRQPDGGVAQFGIGLARLPAGHYCGLRADFDGMVESKWLCNYGHGGVQALAEVNAGGSIQAEILDQFGQILPGWDRTYCRSIRIGEGRYQFSWGNDELLGAYDQVGDTDGRIGHVVKLRFYLQGATLYGFQVGQPGAMSTGG